MQIAAVHAASKTKIVHDQSRKSVIGSSKRGSDRSVALESYQRNVALYKGECTIKFVGNDNILVCQTFRILIFSYAGVSDNRCFVVVLLRFVGHSEPAL